MWKIAYNIALNLILPFFTIFALTRKKMRKNLAERLIPKPGQARAKHAVWVHAASVGEAAIAEALINFMKAKTGVDDFLVTTNTYYTRDLLRKRLDSKIGVFSLPFDLTYSIRRFMRGSTFRALIIVETELWPNLIWEAKKLKLPVIVINGRISDSTLENYKRFSFFLKHVLSGIELVLAQSEEHAQRFVSIGTDRVKVVNSGNLKYYRALSNNSSKLIKENVLTFGSIKEKELEILLPIIADLKKAFPEILIFVVPRELFLVSAIEEGLSAFTTTTRYSNFRSVKEKAIGAVVVDTVGDLLDIYKISKVAFVGGSLAPYGGQNILEPLFFGTPVIFGPYMENFKDIAATIIKEGAGMQVDNGKDLYGRIKLLLENEPLRNQMGSRGLKIIEMQRAVMESTVDAIMKVIDERRSGNQ
jgi:3-deoxy-D-manno-octulosonic-acid transferase